MGAGAEVVFRREGVAADSRSAAASHDSPRGSASSVPGAGAGRRGALPPRMWRALAPSNGRWRPRSTLAALSLELGAKGFLRRLSPDKATVTSLGRILSSWLLPENGFWLAAALTQSPGFYVLALHLRWTFPPEGPLSHLGIPLRSGAFVDGEREWRLVFRTQEP